MINETTWKRIFTPKWNHEDVLTDTEWSSIVDGDTLRLSFQGSISKLDWRQNFQGWRIPYKRMKKLFFVHAGFLKKWKAVENEIIQLCSNPAVKKVEVYGFSQGAAVATLCVESLGYHFPKKIVSGIVYGSPRVVSIFGAKEFSSRINLIRVEYGNDLVTKVPPIFLLYKHVGTCYHIGEKRRWWKFSVKQHSGAYYKGGE